MKFSTLFLSFTLSIFIPNTRCIFFYYRYLPQLTVIVTHVSHGEIEVRKSMLVKKCVSLYITFETLSLSWCTSIFVFCKKKGFVQQDRMFFMEVSLFICFRCILFIWRKIRWKTTTSIIVCVLFTIYYMNYTQLKTHFV